MDIFRTLLATGLVVLLWNIQIRGIRPVRDFVLWGILYPFHFALMGVLTLAIWGLLGASFGVQGIFLVDNPWIQMLLGADVMLLFAALILHYSLLDTPARWRNHSLKTLIRVLRDLNRMLPAAYPVQRLLRNGLLERFGRADIEAIDEAIQRDVAAAPTAPSNGPTETDLEALLRDEPFRLLVAPAILSIKGLMLVFLVGVMPVIVIPLLNRDPQALRERLPWLVGVVQGEVVGIFLACRTTRWVTRAAGWERFEERVLTAIQGWACAPEHAAPAQAVDDLPAAGHGVAAPAPASPRWVFALLLFFLIHFVVNMVLPESLTSYWIDWPEKTYIAASADGGVKQPASSLWRSIPWLPLGVLLAEAIGAGAVQASLLVLSRSPLHARGQAFWACARAQAAVVVRQAIERLSQRRAREITIGVMAAMALLAVGGSDWPGSVQSGSLAGGLRSALALGVFLASWLVSFRMATLTPASAPNRSRARIGAAAVLFALVLLYLAHAPSLLISAAAMVTVIVQLARATPADMRLGWTWLRVRTALVALAGAVACGSLWALWVRFGTSVVTASWVGLAVAVLGAGALSETARRRPALAYPLTLLVAFVAFALPYNALDPRWQSAMPAAGSLACMVALIAAVFTIIASLRPKSRLMASLAVVAALFLINGNAWFVAPNEFKAPFPHMEAYYARPVYLDSQDYVRDTTPSTVRLQRSEAGGRFGPEEQQVPSERLATADFQVLGQRPGRDGSSPVVLSVEDPSGRLRAGPGDEVRVASEEWYTIAVEGSDCIALAEEPFYRKIFRDFRYERVQLIRDGIVRGTPYRLAPAVELDAKPARESSPAQTPIGYEFITGPGTRLGFRLLGLGPAYRAANAQYVLIAMHWSGRVSAVRHGPHSTAYEVEFKIPKGTERLSASELTTMGAWLERCHLDALRTATAVALKRAGNELEAQPSNDLAAEPGGCYVLEDARAEAPIPVACYLAGAGDGPPELSPFLLSRKNLAQAIAAAPPPFLLPGGAPAPVDDHSFTLRPAHDRGIFASPARATGADTGLGARGPADIALALYNFNRIQPGDRLILSWKRAGDQGGGQAQTGGIFEVLTIGQERAPGPWAAKLPSSYAAATLRPIAGARPDGSAQPPLDLQRAADLVVGQWQVLEPLNNAEVLTAWKQLVSGLWARGKPKLVIVTVSGGGIRASVWTALVLRKLERTLGADFPYHVRLITGASGGMVGGSYYATSLGPPPRTVLAGGRAGFATLHGVSPDDFVDRMATDQLDAVAGRLTFADLISPLNPFLQHGDRGKTLEQTWADWTGGESASPLARPLQSYAVDERMGWRPSMVYTPMMVEDGRRLLISNLDLMFATRNVGGLLLEPSSRKIERPAFQSEDLDRSIHTEDEVFSLSAVEFSRLFPEAHDFRVSTAVRMSASFPWVSPAVSLPTLPPRRVVDAGYYDNYGVNLTALWLTKLRPWLEANTSGVVVIQIRDHVSQGARTEIDFDRLSGRSALDLLTWHADRDLLGPGIQAISTPMLGLSNARLWTMSFRNDEQVDLLDLLFDDERGRDFFRTVVFECPVEVSLNWKLSARERDVLTSGFGRADSEPHQELASIADYLTGRDSFEFHKWQVARRSDPAFQRDLKAAYDKELRALGVQGTGRLTLRQSQELYENIVKNLKRLELLRDWWREGHR